MWSDLTLETTAEVLANGVTRGAATLICDGSYFYDLDPTKGGACWILETDECHLHQASSCLQSTKTTASAYRSELVGIYGGLRFVKKLCEAENVTSGALRVGCDNLTAVNRCPGSLKVPTNANHSDIL